MIGVIAAPSEHSAVREFFELFKTPWEFCRSGRPYDVLLFSGDGHFDGAPARLVLVYAGTKTSFDVAAKVQVESLPPNTVLSYQGSQFPIYGDSIGFRHDGVRILEDRQSKQSAAYLREAGATMLVRVGYDLFREVRTLLTVGQPPANASIPALDLHIALLRDLIVGAAVPLIEIPPLPDSHGFLACLTHDIDHPSIRHHKWDHTMFGFLYRAVFGSLVNVLRGRASVRNLLANWRAALMLPFVHLGLARDFWYDFDRYLAIERGLASTLFVIPFKHYPGHAGRGEAHRKRASRYDPSDIADHIRTFLSAGCEIGLHGIDAWRDSSQGRDELEQVARTTKASAIGVRMHWLYFDEHSAATLERAGFSYDSTSGYNETVGYRAGTTQAFRPLGATQLLELPLHLMDTALFYPCHLNLSPREARKRADGILDNALRFGGAVTVNWHDRSIAPERLWGQFYVELLDELKRRRPWFATAAQTVAWFRKRRSALFETVTWETGGVRAKVSLDARDHLPGLRLRIHKPRASSQFIAVGADSSNGYLDIPLNESIDTRISL